MNAAILIGRGVLTWTRGERIGDRYGSVWLMQDGTEAQTEIVIPKGNGRLVATILDARESSHIGDFFRGYSENSEHWRPIHSRRR